MYKLVAIDLDGTLLNSHGTISEETKRTLVEVQKQEVNIVLASGRPIDSIKAIAKEIGGQKYFIAGNGAIVYDIENEKIIYEKCLPKEKLLKIIKICEENSIGYSVYTENEILTSALKYNVLYYHKENAKKPENQRTKINLISNVYEHIKNDENSRFLKVTICDEDKAIFNSIIRKVREISDIEVLDVAHMARKIIKQGTDEIPVEYYYTEVSQSNVDKWYAIEFLAQKLEIKTEEIMAIGDNINDKIMIEKAGLGVAMEQSTPIILNIANEVTKSNNEEGVAKILQKYYKNINF